MHEAIRLVINIIANITSIKYIVIQEHSQQTLVIRNIPLINIKKLRNTSLKENTNNENKNLKKM